MKKLLYLFVMTIAVSSCSVDPIEDPISFEDDTLLRSAKEYCASAVLVNTDGEAHAYLETYVFPKKDLMVIEITSKWKINTSKLYVGSLKNSPMVDPSNIDESKFQFNESYIDGTYAASFKLKMSDIGPKSCLAAKVEVKNDIMTQVLWAQGVEWSQEMPGIMFIPEFAGNCLGQ
ncbi:MAG: hypothetical protein KJO25_06290 [Bacteroidia bacterium]|nr:hypothetical protein [Bacteroidia bacterium]NNK74053.1 hypothetical protein [Flavobacteriaceae bacterium]